MKVKENLKLKPSFTPAIKSKLPPFPKIEQNNEDPTKLYKNVISQPIQIDPDTNERAFDLLREINFKKQKPQPDKKNNVFLNVI